MRVEYKYIGMLRLAKPGLWQVHMQYRRKLKRPEWLFDSLFGPFFPSMEAAADKLALSGFIVDFSPLQDGRTALPIYQLKPVDTKTQPD